MTSPQIEEPSDSLNKPHIYLKLSQTHSDQIAQQSEIKANEEKITQQPRTSVNVQEEKAALGTSPQMMVCPLCRSSIKTGDIEPGCRSHFAALCSRLFFGCLGCCCIPHCKSKNSHLIKLRFMTLYLSLQMLMVFMNHFSGMKNVNHLISN